MDEQGSSEIELPDGTTIERHLNVDDLSEESIEQTKRLIERDAIVFARSALYKRRRPPAYLQNLIQHRRHIRDYGDDN